MTGGTGALRALMAGVVDYAGLFPPAALDMPRAVANYAEYLASPDAWALGRFVVPVARLGELADAKRALVAVGAPWQLAALAGSDLAADVERIGAFNAGHRDAVVDTIESRMASAEEIARLAPLARGYDLFVEVPVAGDPLPLLRAVRDAGAKAKIRTGGVTADAFPTSEQVARFLAACVSLGVPCKATAGLHHPIRAAYRLTYAPDAPSGTMFGFLNVFLAAAFLRAGASEGEARAILSATDPADFAFDDGGVAWRGRRLTTEALREARSDVALSFGSCSFREPIDDLQALELLPR